MMHYNTPYMEIIELEAKNIDTISVSNVGGPGQQFPTLPSLNLMGDPSDSGDF